MRAHWSYLKYVIRHKWFVGLWMIRLGGSWWGAIVHDWTKFLPSEWFPYVRQFYNGDGTRKKWEKRLAFDIAWNFHQKRNPHHWQYWVLITDNEEPRHRPLPIPDKYCIEMAADWIGAGRAITGKYEFWKWYEENKEKMILHEPSREYVRRCLNKAFDILDWPS